MNNKNNSNNKITVKSLWKAFRSKKGKRYSFVIFYIFFFLFLFIYLAANKNIDSNVVEEENTFPFNTSYLEYYDYDFKYIVNTNLDELLYKGKCEGDKITVMDDTGEYEFYYKNAKLVSDTENNIIHSSLLDIFEIKRMVKKSKLISETKMADNLNYIYNYTITNDDLNSIFGTNNIINKNLTNEIIIKTDSKKNIKEVNLNLLNYEREFNNDLKIFNITLEYGDIYE